MEVTSTETTAVETQAVDAAKVTPTQAVKTTSAEPQAGEAPESMSLEEAKKLRQEAQALRKRLKGYEDVETAAREAALSEVEKSNKRATDAEARIKLFQQELINERVINAASKKNAVDPEMAALALQGKLEYGDDGMPTNLDKALADLIKNKPYLFPEVKAQAEPAPTSPATSAQTPNAPATPPSNPGRSSIVSPLSAPTSTRYVAPTWNDIYRS